MALLPRPGILDVQPYVGGEAKAPGINRVVRLASNENPLGCSPKAAEAYRALAGELHRYPDGGAKDLRETLARIHGLEASRIVCGAGSDELIALLVRAYAGEGDEVLYSRHGFLMYDIAARTAGARPVAAPETDLTADVDALLGLVSPVTRIVFLANPNNPTGSYLPASEVRRLREGLPEEVLLVIDAAYAEYVEAEDYEAGSRIVEACDNVVMTRTFSKIYGLAALRLGWAYCPPAVADVLNRLRGPFNVSQAAQAAGVAALEDQDFVARSRRENSELRGWVSGALAGLGLTVHPSEGNFLLVSFPGGEKAAAEALAALKARGVLLRGMSSYGLPESLRITVGTREEMEITLEALRDLAS
jgi:histidinol-phosphate aminotransferase